MIVEIKNGAWQMTIDLLYVCVHAGQRARYYDDKMRAHSYIPFTYIHARKIFRLIKHYGDSLTIRKAGNFIKLYCGQHDDKRIWEQWEKA